LRVQLGIGLIIAVLLPLVLLLFGILRPYETISAMLLLAGLWILVFSVTYGSSRDRTYNVGTGLIIALLSTFYFIPLRYTIGLVLIAVIGMVVISVVAKPKAAANKMTSPS
jgi:hypothetical protein